MQTMHATVQQSCPNCRSADLVDVQISLRDAAVRFELCRSCEHRWWTRANEDAVIDLPDVLGLVAAK